MYLTDRGRRNRDRVERREQRLQRRIEFALDHRAVLFEREWRDRVLKQAQLGRDIRGNKVGPRRQQLPELDEGRAELVEQLAQVAPHDSATDCSDGGWRRSGRRSNAYPKPWRAATRVISRTVHRRVVWRRSETCVAAWPPRSYRCQEQAGV